MAETFDVAAHCTHRTREAPREGARGIPSPAVLRRNQDGRPGAGADAV